MIKRHLASLRLLNLNDDNGVAKVCGR
jgi:hypothetical protein